MWGNPRPPHTRCASGGDRGVFRCSTAFTRENSRSQESHDTPRRRAQRWHVMPHGGAAQGAKAPWRTRKPPDATPTLEEEVSGRQLEESQTPAREPSTRGRRECGTRSVSRIGRVSRSGSMSNDPAPPSHGGGSVCSRRAPVGADGSALSASAGTSGSSPVSAARCRPGSAGARWRPRGPPPTGAIVDAGEGTSTAVDGAAAGAEEGAAAATTATNELVSGARRRPPERGAPPEVRLAASDRSLISG